MVSFDQTLPGDKLYQVFGVILFIHLTILGHLPKQVIWFTLVTLNALKDC